MISQIMLTFSCDKCGAEKQRPASEDDKTSWPMPYGWVSFDSSEDSRKRHKCLECCARDGYATAEEELACRELNPRVPQKIVDAVMSWREVFVAGEEDKATVRCDDVFNAAATLVLGEEGVAEAGKLHNAAIAESQEPFPVEAGYWYGLRDGRISHCHHVVDGIAHTAHGHCNAEDGKSLSDRALDIVRKTKTRRRFFDHTIDDPEVLSLFKDKEIA